MSPSCSLLLLSTHIIATYTYYLSQNSLSFINSNLYCNTLCDSSLASIHSSSQYNSIINILTPLSTAWIGLNDINSEGNFIWIDNSQLNYTNWNSSSPPIQDATKNCVQINKDTSYWQIASCNTKQYFICNHCDNSNSPTFEPTFEPTTEPTTEPTLEPTIQLSFQPSYYPTIEPTIYNKPSITQSTKTGNNSKKDNIFLTDYLWLAVIAGTILLLACCCGMCICYQRKKQYNKAMKDKHTEKYRKHLKSASRISNTYGNLDVPKREKVTENSINLEMAENYSNDNLSIRQSMNTMIHLSTPKTDVTMDVTDNKTETCTSLADLVIGDDVMSDPNKYNGLLQGLYRNDTDMTGIYGGYNNDDDKTETQTDVYDGSVTTQHTTFTQLTANTRITHNVSANGNVTPMMNDNETEIGFSVIDYMMDKDDEEDPLENSSDSD